MMPQFADEPERRIVGVVGDTRDRGLTTEPRSMIFVPQAQVPDEANALVAGLTPIAWVVRTDGTPGALSQVVQEEIRRVTGLPISNVRTMDDVRSRSIARERFNMWLMGAFGGVALFLAAMGLYGLLAYSVEQRTREIGIRLALGASPGRVGGLLLQQGVLPALVGLSIGVAAALALTRLLSGLLFGVTPHDPVVLAGVPALLLVVSLLASWIPSGRASRIDPLVALGHE
jgi:predicted lysophospholipase L1 biosynthesis ABC-type transport system permease subunit